MVAAAGIGVPDLDRTFELPPRLREHLARLYPEHEITAIEPLAPDTGKTSSKTLKAAGYGRPVRIVLSRGDDVQEIVFRVATADEFGHARRSDRAANLLLAFDDFSRVPEHVAPIDVGMIDGSGAPISLRDGVEPYLLTTFVRGTIYAEDLRRVARTGAATDQDVARVGALARYLARLHTPIDDPAGYRRAIRDLIGHGEGIFGIIDGYPPDVPGAPAERLAAIERRCVEWRWRLRAREGRLVRTHGDFHPFNIVFGEGGQLTLLDASRGTQGDAADDLTALAINYLLFAIDAPAAWRRGLAPLWRELWRTYASERSDASLLACVPPFLAWRALVVCNPRFYPALSEGGRHALLGFIEAALDAAHFEPGWADELFS
ncbi:MAG TPA: aminoglycoside phosphotransferase family protein [Kofleriaceae bacterium]|nr:aminoglycoside phosphotransferase family protein [Kofleriaceae bacterium]